MRNRITHTLTLAILAVLLLASPVLAAQRPAELDGIVKSSAPYGQGSLSRFLFHVYDAEVWTDAEHWSYEAPFALMVTYAMSFSAQELVESTLKEARHVAELSADEEKRFDGYLTRAYHEVKSGDRIGALYTPPDKVSFYLNGKKAAIVEDKAFSRAFFDIWLSEKTSEPSLRAGLLGLHS